MNIYLLFRNSFPYGMASSQHVTCEALGLKAGGANLKVIVFVPSVNKGHDDGLPTNGVYKGVSYDYIHGKFRPFNIVNCILNRFWNTIKTFFWGVKHYNKGDIVYCYGGDNLTLMLFTWAAHIRKAKMVVELVEIPFYGTGIISRLRRWFDTFFLFPHFDALVCISHSLLNFSKKFSCKNTPMHLLPILVEDNKRLRIKKNPYNVPYIVHTGTMSEQKDGISYILKAFSEFKKTDKTKCRLVFTGPDANKENCKYNPLIRDLKIIDSVDLMGMIETREEILNLQYFSSMSIVYKMENIQTKFCFATKIGEILMAGVPLIATNACEQIYYLRDKDNAILVEPGDINELANAMHYVLAHSEEVKVIAEHGRQLAFTDFNPIIQGKKLFEFFKSL